MSSHIQERTHHYLLSISKDGHVTGVECSMGENATHKAVIKSMWQSQIGNEHYSVFNY